MYKTSFHDHPLFPSPRFVMDYCEGCITEGTIYGGYYCNDPNCTAWFFHKKCAEAPLQINHPSHPNIFSYSQSNWEMVYVNCVEKLYSLHFIVVPLVNSRWI
ncbi:hypothetical protein Bca52824_044002 [Brassica carinata]|uniref:DC1 domain-containing protein n=1 Tax=Brassica carinata TaxID=52824 RepID=A0A8X7S159_BRACI|nr:hypothetical protein Bca52824_044002 [Brassica carinata]